MGDENTLTIGFGLHVNANSPIRFVLFFNLQSDNSCGHYFEKNDFGMKFRLKHTCDITQGVINRRVTWKAKAWFKPGNSRSNGLSTIVSRKGKNTKVGFACTSCVLEG